MHGVFILIFFLVVCFCCHLYILPIFFNGHMVFLFFLALLISVLFFNLFLAFFFLLFVTHSFSLKTRNFLLFSSMFFSFLSFPNLFVLFPTFLNSTLSLNSSLSVPPSLILSLPFLILIYFFLSRHFLPFHSLILPLLNPVLLGRLPQSYRWKRCIIGTEY